MAANNVFSSIKNKSVVHSIMKQIEEALLNKDLKPGDKLPSEGELVASMNVGKSSVREALRMLEALGVVETRHGEGSFIVEKPSVNGINPLIYSLLLEQGSNSHILELRQIIEPMYTVLACQKITDEQLQKLEQIVEQMENNVSSGMSKEELDLLFHHTILEITDNPYIIRIGETVNQLFTYSIMRSIKNNPEICVSDHRRILEAMKRQDSDAVQRAVLQSFEGWKINL